MTPDLSSNPPENPFEAQLQNAQTPPEPPLQPRRRSPWPLLLLLPVVGIGGFVYYRQRKAEEVRRFNRATIVLPERMARVPGAWNADTLAERLEKSRKIRDADAFREAADAVGLKNVVPGSYLLPARANPLDLARAFQAGPTHQDVTFPEGFTAAQFAARLRKNGFAGATELSQIPPAKLEGHLFPDTYTLPLRSNGAALVALFEARWQSEMKKLPRPFPKIAGKEMTPAQVVTLASLVEREAGSRSEMPLVAGVLVGRLRQPMRLQVDASIQYARLLEKQGHKSRLLFDDLKIDSPFNTYRNDGLPPTPICNPGAAALRAAARPAPTKALFYVYSPKLKRHLFAETYAEHLRKVALVRKERGQLEKQNKNAAIAG
ncbi:UPF0755 protein [Abditibacterium utsteinense]|uniref:Endolytic murein transglycosylase n=1 Tax=Abditibacterium utsteinense TaxID=1960156 RepID=A0A2S8SQZ6_9BACT|nr:endolytic transglycosylase MltG [Abditibacterium utsteinense]PQV63205.1 UPF0755 protein [Abditibacterium utsteinense]